MTAVYVNGMGAISPQKTFGQASFPEALVQYEGMHMNCIEPNYDGLIDAKSLRRMSRIIRMATASALQALKEARVAKPDAIVTGTAFGCLEDTEAFLSKMITNQEEALNPTPFMQSTHNTIGSQIALMLQCYGYNQTYVHRAFSFETALMDAMMLIDEMNHLNVLAGGIDEVTDASHRILSRFGLFHKDLKQGEGATFFLLSGIRENTSYARIQKVSMIYKPGSEKALEQKINMFLEDQHLDQNDIDLILTGSMNGNSNYIDIGRLFKNCFSINYKSLCGEYATSTAFALWMAASILKNKTVPDIFGASPKEVKKILIANSYFGIHHSLILVEAC